MASFRYSYWDSFLIILQIISIQSLFYFTLCSLILLFSYLCGESPSLASLFNYQYISLKFILGFFVILSYLITAFLGSVYLWYIVQRAKPCLDYSLTVYLIHLMICWFYNASFPKTFSWWILQIISTACMCVFGEYLCMRTEMKSIPLLSSQKTDL